MLQYLGWNTQNIKINKKEIIKEGSLMKKSRVLKEWRNRYTIITQSFIFTFKQGPNNENYPNIATETIKIEDIESVKSDDDPLSSIFYIMLKNIVYTFKAESFNEKEEWIEFLNRIVNRSMKIKYIKRRSEIYDES